MQQVLVAQATQLYSRVMGVALPHGVGVSVGGVRPLPLEVPQVDAALRLCLLRKSQKFNLGAFIHQLPDVLFESGAELAGSVLVYSCLLEPPATTETRTTHVPWVTHVSRRCGPEPAVAMETQQLLSPGPPVVGAHLQLPTLQLQGPRGHLSRDKENEDPGRQEFVLPQATNTTSSMS